MPDFDTYTTAFPPELLHAIYNSFHSLSAHFHFMLADWRRGRSCSASRTHSEIVSGIRRCILL